MPDGDDLSRTTHECWTVLAALAARVPRVRIGALVSGNPYRNPSLVAKMAASVDQISGGRFVLGMGTGWQENEHRAYGFEFHSIEDRRARLDEACEAITRMLTSERANFGGEHYTIVEAPLEPKPVQDRIPLLIGGSGKHLLRIVAQRADIWNTWGTPDVIAEKTAILDAHCADIGRDPAEIQRTAQALVFMSDDPAVVTKLRSLNIYYPSLIGTPEEIREAIAAYAETGVTEFILPDFNMRNFGERISSLDAFQEQVIPHFA